MKAHLPLRCMFLNAWSEKEIICFFIVETFFQTTKVHSFFKNIITSSVFDKCWKLWIANDRISCCYPPQYFCFLLKKLSFLSILEYRTEECYVKLTKKNKTLTSMRFDCLYVYHIQLHHFVDKKKEKKTTTTKTKDKTDQT